MKEIDSNKQAWSQLSQDHYCTIKKSLLENKHQFNKYIQKEFGNLTGRRIIHLQCNTGADTILLAKTGKSAVGVDLVPDNIFYARKLAEDLNVTNISFGDGLFNYRHNTDKFPMSFSLKATVYDK